MVREKGKRRASKAEQPEATKIENVRSVPDKPKNLGKRGDKVWQDLCEKLAKSNIICEYDGRLLAAYCFAAGEVEVYREFLIKNGRFKTLANKTKTPREEVKALKEAEERFMKLGAQLGLSPASRKALNIKIEYGDTGTNDTSTDTEADLCGR